MNPTINPSDDGRSQRELAYQATKAAEEEVQIQKTPSEIVKRYREARHWRINRHECVIHWLREAGPGTIADFGCGSGEMAVRLAAMGHEVTGFDASPELVELARKRAALDGVSDLAKFEVCDFDGANLKERNFDAVLAQSILHHLPIEQGIGTLHGLLRPGGHASIMEPVAFTRWLQFIRDLTPVRKDVSPDERQLNQCDIELITETLPLVKIRYFYLTQRLGRVFRGSHFASMNRSLQRLDQILMACPGMKRLSGSVVMLVRRP